MNNNFGIFYKNNGGRWSGPYVVYSSLEAAKKNLIYFKRLLKKEVQVRKANWVGVN